MFDFITESFDIQKTNEYILSIQVSLDGFSFSVFHPQENKILAYKCSSLKISGDNLIQRHFGEWLQNEELIQKNFLKVFLICFTGEFSLLPENLYNSHLIQEATNNLIVENERKETIVNSIEELNTPAKIVFYIPKNLIEFLNQKFNSFEIIHPVQLMVSQIPKEGKRIKVVVLYHKKSCIIVAGRHDQVLLANGFKTEHVNDLVYYLLNTLMQLNINLNDTDLYLADALLKNEALEKLLFPYFHEITYLPSAKSIANIEKIPNSIHRYFNFN